VSLQVTTFGMGLVTLDVRQESTKHTEAIDTITSYLGLGSYKEWDEAKRQEFLLKELTGKRPLLPPGAAPDPVCATFGSRSMSPRRRVAAMAHLGMPVSITLTNASFQRVSSKALWRMAF